MLRHGFDYYVRSITTALIALAIVAAAIYDVLALDGQDVFLIGSGGIVIGFYFGAHVSVNGRRTQPPRGGDDATSAAVNTLDD